MHVHHVGQAGRTDMYPMVIIAANGAMFAAVLINIPGLIDKQYLYFKNRVPLDALWLKQSGVHTGTENDPTLAHRYTKAEHP